MFFCIVLFPLVPFSSPYHVAMYGGAWTVCVRTVLSPHQLCLDVYFAELLAVTDTAVTHLEVTADGQHRAMAGTSMVAASG